MEHETTLDNAPVMIALALASLLAVNLTDVRERPLLGISVDAKRNSTLTIVSRVPWTLSRSTDLVRWETLTSGQPAAPGAVQVFTGIDYVWGHRADRAFYRVQARPASLGASVR